MKVAAAVVGAAIALVIGFFFAGCGADDPGPSAPPTPARSGWLSHGLKLVTITVDGTDMLCLERRGAYDTAVSGQYAGLSCDWDGWHRKRER